jgi:hypothetical protein
MTCAVVNLYSPLLQSFAGLESLGKYVHVRFFPATDIVVITFTLSDMKSFNLLCGHDILCIQSQTCLLHRDTQQKFPSLVAGLLL